MKSAPVRPVGIVVLGMHRSGTSLLTRVLNLLGCALPKNLLGAHESNPRGHWESLDAIEINDTLLSALGRRWDDVRELPADWLDREETEVARQRIRSLLEREFSSQPMWVLKEPRLCRLAPLWLEQIAALDMDARVIVPVRHPREVSHSLARRNNLDAGRSYLLWWQHLVEAERASRHLPRTFLHFHSLVTDWRTETQRMAAELGVEWTGRSATVAEKINRFIDPKLRHADALGHASSDSLHPLPALVESLYGRLLELHGAEIWEAIASADASLDTVRSLYAPAIEGLALAVEKADRHASAVDAVLSSNLVDRQNLVLDTDQVRLLREQSYGILDKIEQNGPLIVELVKQVEAQRSELAILTSGVVQRNQELASQLSTIEGELIAKVLELEAASARLVEIETALAESELVRQLDRERHSMALESLASFERESDSLRRAIALTNLTVARYEAQLGRARAANESLQVRLDSSVAERDEAQQRLGALASQAAMQQQNAKEIAERLGTNEQQLAAMERSSSWRLTAPLRALVRSVRGS